MYKYRFTYLVLQLKNDKKYHTKNIGLLFPIYETKDVGVPELDSLKPDINQKVLSGS